MKEQISYEEYKEDIIVLFHILKSRYSLYQEFGGDKVFNDLKEKALKKFENEKSIKTKDAVTYLLEDLFVNEINDLHFTLDNKAVNIPKFRIYLYKPYIENIKDIKSIDGDTDLSKYIFKTLDENGRLKDTIKINSPFEKFYKTVTVEYKDGKKETLDLKLISSIGYPRADKVEIHKDYVYVRFTSFMNDIRKEYVDKLDKIKNKDLILDLRNNSGGYIYFISPLLRTYYDLPFSITDLSFYDYAKSYRNSYTDVHIEGKILKRNKNKIYLIVDNNSASASEHILSILKFMDYKNVIVLGTNTNGVYINSRGRYFYLKNSKIEISFGGSLVKKIKEYHGEGKGFYPDIWLDLSETDILERILKFRKKL